MRILVTGSRGFIGSILMARGKEQGHRMTGVDDFSRGLNEMPSLKFDCRNGVSQILDEFTYSSTEPPFEAIVHLAAGTGSLDRPYEELVELNVEMTKKIFAEAVSYGVKVFAFPTTSLVEGVPDSPYVRSKQDAMDWLLGRAGMHNIRLIPMQFYNVTGGYKNYSEIRQREVHIVPTMLEKFIKNEPFIINGGDYDTLDGTPGRDFSNVNQVTDFILHLVYTQLRSSFLCGGVIKIGTGCITTALEMVNHFNSIVNSLGFLTELHHEIGPKRAFDCAYLRCDQPYLHVFRPPVLAAQSLKEELQVLLQEVYKL
jgi:UDP-glucose 4-epimerase